jgi:LacI family transcriptional regulator
MLASQLAAEEKGYSCVLSSSTKEGIPMPLQQSKVDGVLLAGVYWPNRDGILLNSLRQDNDAFVCRILDSDYPLVVVSNPTTHPGVHRINPDYATMMKDAIARLTAKGHRRIGYLGGDASWPAFAERLEAFLVAMEAGGLSAGYTITYPTHNQLDEEAIRLRLRRLLASPDRPTALIIGSGPTERALGVIADAGLSVPGDISIIALSDTPQSLANIAIYEMPTQAMARSAVTRLIALMDGHSFTEDMRLISEPIPFYLGASLGNV